MSHLPERPLPSTTLVQLSLQACLRHISALWLWLLLAFCFSSIAYFYMAYLNAEQAALGEAAPHTIIVTSFVVRAFQLIYPFILSVILVWLYLSMLYHSNLLLKRAKVTLRMVIHLVNARYIKFFVVVIVTFIILGLLLPLILPFLFILPILLLAAPAVAIDNYGFFTSFKHAWQLVWRNWWHTFIVILLLLLVPIFIVSLLTTTLQQIVSPLLQPYVIAFGALMNLLLYLFLSSNTLLILYNDLRLRYKAQPN